MALVWEQIVIDSHHPVALGQWWTQALSWVVVNDSAHEFEIRETPDRLPGLIFTPVGDPKIGKNRLHIDLRPDDQQAEVARLLALGATKADIGQGDEPWVVLADPEGNEFCVLADRQTSARVSATTDETTPS